jgi:SAM-dependent methyltransferase
MSTQFTSIYASAYDLLNSQKPYRHEVAFLKEIYSLTTRNANPPTSVLDLGCGSGQHLVHFENHVFKVGVDLSEYMLNIATSKNIDNAHFCKADISEFKSDTKFDLVYSLFHVLSYQIANRKIQQLFQNIHNNLSREGVAVLDFWHRAAWDNDPPVTRITTTENEFLKVIRVSEPTVDRTNGIVDIAMNVFVQSKTISSASYDFFTEQHVMRAFSISELTLFAQLAGLNVAALGPWMNVNGNLQSSDWYGWIALTKRDQLDTSE